MATVRIATLDDMPDYMRLAAAFVATTPVNHFAPFDMESTVHFVSSALQNENMRILVAEEDGAVIGITGALVYPMYFNQSKLVGQELWWYISPEYRGGDTSKLMMAAIEDWCRDMGAVAMFMIALADSRVGVMERVYNRAGYVPTERTFAKELQPWR